MEHQPSILALIPARGGSKGIPRKNIVPLAGRPLIAHTIAAARQATCLDRVVVSTDDDEIAAVAASWGADVPFRRPAELAGDTAAGLDVAMHALAWLAEHRGYRPDFLIELQPVAPLRRAEDIDGALRILLDSDADTVVGLTEAEHPYYLRRVADDGVVVPFVPDAPETFRRQDLPPVYRLNGALLATRTALLLEKRSFYGGRTRGYVMPPERSIDIDTPLDLQIAEALLGSAAQ